MQKMMTYSEANSVLGSSLTPANRCLSKAVAIANDANPDLLANFDNARLVPASVIEQNTHWIDEHVIEHYFVDENGNNIGTSLNITVPKSAAYYIVRTKALLDGQPFPSYMMGGMSYADDQHPMDFDWVHNMGNISYLTQNRYSDFEMDVDWLANVEPIREGTSGHWPVTNSDGTTDFLIKFQDVTDNDSRYGLNGKFGATVDINTDVAQQIKMDYKGSFDPWIVIANFTKDLSANYGTSDFLVEFPKKKTIDECTKTISVVGFEEGFTVEYIGWNIQSDTLHNDDYNKFSSATIHSSAITLTGVKETVPPYEYENRVDCYNIYKIVSATNPNKIFYFQVVRRV